MSHRKHIVLTNAALALTALITAAPAQAAAVYGLRDYFESLGSTYAAQSATNLWTFHDGSHSGSLFTPSGPDYRGPTQYQQIGAKVDSGTGGCSPGYCPPAPATTLATFDGVFVHPAAATPTAAVFHALEDLQLDEIRLWSETVANGASGNGFDVRVRAIINGIAQEIGAFDFNYANTVSSRLETVYTPGLVLRQGDMLEILYGNAGSYLFDHGNVNAFLSTSAVAPANAVPAPHTLALAGLGLAALLRRRCRA